MKNFGEKKKKKTNLPDFMFSKRAARAHQSTK